MKVLNGLFIASWLTLTAAGQGIQSIQSPQSPQTAQTPQTPQGQPLTQGQALNFDSLNAYQTRELFGQILRQYPPFLREIFQLDPSLLTNPSFLAPYPNLSAFIAQHPEIVRNAAFYVGAYGRDYNNDTPGQRSYRMFERIMGSIGFFTAGIVLLGVFCWVVKTAVDHRRWLRVSKVQSDVHSKLLDRFTSNQDLLAYIETPAGRHFLESAPIATEAPSRSLSAPVGRILFSVQAGIVLALGGLGLHIVSQWLTDQEIAQPLFVVGVLSLSVGIGFVISAVVSYVLSRRLGLLDQAMPSTADGAGVSPPHA